MQIPKDYLNGYRAARRRDPEGADIYVSHTTVGDPLADAAVSALANLPPAESERIIRASMDRVPDQLRTNPPEVAAFFNEAGHLPDWADLKSHAAGTRLFFRHSNIVLAAMLTGVLVEGFSTNISKAFLITGRLQTQGVTRLRRNNDHLIEIFMPGGMERDGEGWKLSVRLRLVHAQARYLLAKSPDWNHEAWGTPISAAHVGFGAATFSARLLHHMERLGARVSNEERRSFMAVWRFAGHLMGVPEPMLFEDEDDANRIYRTGLGCEPPPDDESIIMAHALINSAPLALGKNDVEQRRAMARHIFEVSRALIGNHLADELRFPRTRTLGVLPWFRLKHRFNARMTERIPGITRQSDFQRFIDLLKSATFDRHGIPYRLPNHVYHERSHQW